MRVLSFTTVFPNAAMPQHGLFVLERLRHCASHAEIRVVAPRPFYPWPAMQASRARSGMARCRCCIRPSATSRAS